LGFGIVIGAFYDELESLEVLVTYKFLKILV